MQQSPTIYRDRTRLKRGRIICACSWTAAWVGGQRKKTFWSRLLLCIRGQAYGFCKHRDQYGAMGITGLGKRHMLQYKPEGTAILYITSLPLSSIPQGIGLQEAPPFPQPSQLHLYGKLGPGSTPPPVLCLKVPLSSDNTAFLILLHF